MKNERSQIAVILGMHRSGTSAVASVFEKLGFFIGDDFIDSIEEVNAKGFWESRALVEMDNQLLTELGLHWYDPLLIPDDLWESPKVKALRVKATAWLKKEFSGHSRVAIKDPRLCRLLPFWRKAIDKNKSTLRPVYIVRHPDAVVSSLKKRDGIVDAQGYLLWLLHVTDSFSYIDDSCPIIDYDALLTDWKGVITDQIVARNMMPALKLTKSQTVAIDKIISHDLRHHSSKKSREIDVGFRKDALKLYQIIKSYDVKKIIKAVSDERRRLENVLQCSTELTTLLAAVSVTALNERRIAHDIGQQHSRALCVIQEKDRNLEDNAKYINVCHDRIAAQDLTLSQLGASQERYEHSQEIIRDREAKLEENLGYIRLCEERIRELESVLLDRSALDEENARLSGFVAIAEERLLHSSEAECELRHALHEKNDELTLLREQIADIKEYVAISEQSIQEQGKSLLVNEEQMEQAKAYIQKCESHIVDLDKGIAEMHLQISGSNDYILQCEKRIRELDDIMPALVSQVETLENKLAASLELQKTKDADIECLNQVVINSREAIALQENVIAEYVDTIHVRDKKIRELALWGDSLSLLQEQALQRIAANEATISKQEDEIARLEVIENKYIDAAIELARKGEMLVEYERQICEGNAEIQRLEVVAEKYTMATIELAQKTDLIAHQADEIALAKENINMLESTVDATQKRLTKSEEDNLRALQSVSELSTIRERHESTIAQLESCVAVMEGQLKQSAAHIAGLEDHLKQDAACIAGLEDHLKQDAARIAGLEGQVKQDAARIATLEPFTVLYESTHTELQITAKRVRQLNAENRVILLKLISAQADLDVLKSGWLFRKTKKII